MDQNQIKLLFCSLPLIPVIGFSDPGARSLISKESFVSIPLVLHKYCCCVESKQKVETLAVTMAYISLLPSPLSLVPFFFLSEPVDSFAAQQIKIEQLCSRTHTPRYTSPSGPSTHERGKHWPSVGLSSTACLPAHHSLTGRVCQHYIHR